MNLSVAIRKSEPRPKTVWISPLQAAKMNFQQRLEKTIRADYSRFESLQVTSKEKDDLDWFRTQVKGRLESGRNIWGGVTGDLGSGKTFWAMRVCEEFDPSFNVDRVIFSSKDFIQTVQKLDSGSWIVYDEPGVTMSHRAWMSEANRIVTWFLQSSRYRRVNALFCLPALALMDIAARTILTFQALMLDRGIARVYRIRRNQFSSSPPYFTHRLGTVKTGLPSKELVESYEKRRREWHETFFKERQEQKPEEPEISDTDRIVEAVRKRPQDYVSATGSLSAKKIVANHSCSFQTAYKVKAMVESQNSQDPST